MTLRANISILFCLLSLLAAQAQWNKQDSLRLQQILKGEEELKINTEAVNAIRFDFSPGNDRLQGKPMMSQEKPWMKFIEDLPKNFGDTTLWVKPQYIRALPYTPYTKWNEDPVNDPIITAEKEWIIRIPPISINPAEISHNASAGASVVFYFDADKLLFENLTRRGRAIRRNRKHANAWRTYQDYIPTIGDTTQKDSVLMKQLLLQKAFSLYPNTSVPDSVTVSPNDSVSSTQK